MDKIKLKDYVHQFADIWLDELISNERAFPNYKDGLKDSTRSLLTALARRVEFGMGTVRGENLVSDVPGYKVGGSGNVEKNLFRMASGNIPLIKVVSVEGYSAKGLNRITGKHSQPRYVSVSLTPLGRYVFKYEKYFEKEQSKVDAKITKYKYIKTPVPLSLLIPQVNLSDGVSNKAPNLNILEVLDAYIEHVKQDKKTSTEDLAKHIKGFELTPGTKVLMSNQSLYDLIERGICKAVTLAPIKFYEGEFLIQELPFRYFAKTIMNELNKLHILGVEGKKEGFQSFLITGISAEQSDESLVTVNYQIKPGYTLKDVKSELYKKTSLAERIVYENICLDFDQEKPLTIKSVREVLDYHVDVGLELKEREVRDKITALEEERNEAEFLEKITRKICVDIIGRIIGEPDREKYAEEYLNTIYELMKSRLLGDYDKYNLNDFSLIEDAIIKNEQRIRNISQHRFGNQEEESLMKVLNIEVPVSFTQEELGKIFLKQYEVLYNLNKRNRAINILRTYQEKLNELLESMKKERLKEKLIEEIEDLKKYYENAKFSETLYALKIHEREERKVLKQQFRENLRRMEDEMPVNVLIDKNYNARLSFNPYDTVEGLQQIIQTTTESILMVFNRDGKSYKVPVKELHIESEYQLGDPSNVVAVSVDERVGAYDSIYIFVTNKGRVIVCDNNLPLFVNKNLKIPLYSDEYFVYHNVVPSVLFSDKVSLLVKTEDNLIKKKRLSEFNLKTKFNEFFNLFAGPSKTDLVTDATIVASNSNALNLWSNGFNRIFYTNGFKRNVSYGEEIPYTKTNAIITDNKIPHVNGNIITDLNSLLQEEHFNKLSDILLPIQHEEMNLRLGQINVTDIDFATMITSSRRKTLKLDFVPDQIQIEALLNIYK